MTGVERKGSWGGGGGGGVWLPQRKWSLLIVCEVLNKKDLWAAESCFLQGGGVGLLLGWKAGQDSTGKVCNYLKLLWGFFQREQEVINYLQGERKKVKTPTITSGPLSAAHNPLTDFLTDVFMRLWLFDSSTFLLTSHRQRLVKQESSLYPCVVGQLEHYLDALWIICRRLLRKTFWLPLLLLLKCLQPQQTTMNTSWHHNIPHLPIGWIRKFTFKSYPALPLYS